MTTYTHTKPAGTPIWVDLTAPDFEVARKFYQAVFGWDYDSGGPEFGGYTTARLGQRPAAGLVGPQPGAPTRPVPGRCNSPLTISKPMSPGPWD